MGTRRHSRELALQFLYQIDITGDDYKTALDFFWQNFKVTDEVRKFSNQLIDGIFLHQKDNDSLIEKFSDNWRLHRIAKVDLNILRIAVFELAHCPEIPPKVTLNEAIELAKKYGSRDSSSFINGVLDRINLMLQKNGIIISKGHDAGSVDPFKAEKYS